MNLEVNNIGWCFGTTELITLLGTIATFLAVIVALWQTTSSRKQKIKLELNLVSIFSSLTQQMNNYVNLSVTNVGHCPVKITSWYMFVGDTRIAILNTPIRGTTNTSLPLLLNTAEDGSFFLEQDKFIKNILLKFKQTLIETNTLKTGCYLSTGKLVSINVKLTDLFNTKTIEEVYNKIESLEESKA